MTAQAEVEPVYETAEGWRESTRGARSWADLPATAIKYIRRLEELIGAPVALLSTSPEREDTVLVRDPSPIESVAQRVPRPCDAVRGLAGGAGVIADIAVDVSDEGVDSIGEIMVGAGDLAEIDLDVALVRQLGYELLHRFDRHHRILVALQDQTR